MSKKVKVLPKQVLLEMHTGSLLARRKALLACNESFSKSDQSGYKNEPNDKDTKIIEFKNTKVWSTAYLELKEILATREHVPNKREKREIRIKKAKHRN